MGESLERRQVVAEQLDLDRFRGAFEIAQHVLEDLHELDRHPRCFLFEPVAVAGDDLVDAPRPLAARLEPHQDIAAILLRGE